MIEFHVVIEETTGKLALAVLPHRSWGVTEREFDAYEIMDGALRGGLEKVQQSAPEDSTMIAGADSVRRLVESRLKGGG